MQGQKTAEVTRRVCSLIAAHLRRRQLQIPTAIIIAKLPGSGTARNAVIVPTAVDGGSDGAQTVGVHACCGDSLQNHSPCPVAFSTTSSNEVFQASGAGSESKSTTS